MTLPDRDLRRLRRERERARRAGQRRPPQPARRAGQRRLAVTLALVVVIGAAAAVALAATSGPTAAGGSQAVTGAATRTGRATSGHAGTSRAGSTAASAKGTGVPGHATVPILMYHVINPPPPTAPYPGLYVPASEFTAQMRALRAAGWHAVTLDQLRANWTRGVPLGPGRPIVLSFDNGYASQYTNALPVLRQLGWVGVENIQLSGLPPSQGGLTEAQVRGLIAAGWELDTQGISHADLIRLDTGGLAYQIDTARQILRRRYGVPVNWFCYPSGHYDPTVIAAVRAAGFVGSTTVVPGWASRSDDPYRLPRLRVLGGTSPAALLAQIAAAENSPIPPVSYGSA